MRILLVSPWPPLPENNGMRQLTLNLLRHLAPRHSIDVVGFVKSEADRGTGWEALERELPVRVLRIFPERKGASLHAARAGLLARLRPPSLARWERRDVGRFLSTLDLSRYDVVLLDTLYTATYRKLFRERPTVLLAPDALSMGHLAAARDGFGIPFRARRLVEGALQVRLERQWYPELDAVAFVTERDRAWVERVAPRTRGWVVPTPVPARVFERGARRPQSDKATRVVCWAAVFEPAIARGVADFITRTWPRVRAARPDARLVVWGASPVRQVRSAIARDPSVEHVDFVDDWMETLCSMDVFAYPIRGGAGIFTKIQNALALGLPAVLSREAAQSQGLAQGRDAIVCDTAESYASACVRLLSDRVERERLGAAGRAYALSAFSQAVPGRQLERVLEAAVASHRGGAGP